MTFEAVDDVTMSGSCVVSGMAVKISVSTIGVSVSGKLVVRLIVGRSLDLIGVVGSEVVLMTVVCSVVVGSEVVGTVVVG